MNPQLGIFLCTCDGKIENKIQVDAFQYVMRGNQDVALVQPMSHVCLPDGVRELQDAVRQNHLDRVVIAACPARFQEKRLRDACVAAGVNVNHLAWVDWREGCVRAHRESKQAVTGKAIDLIQMGVARVSMAYPTNPAAVPVSSQALVIGGGIAGITAARTLADRGIKVTLVEQKAELGGGLRGVSSNGASDALASTLAAVQAHANIMVMLNSRVSAVDGAIGNYRVGISSHVNSAQAEITVGAIVIATGAQEYREPGLYRYDGRKVFTLGEFESEISNLQSPVSLAYILCAGSRDAKIPYCSNTCCLNALNQALRAKRAIPETKVTILFRDLYLLGDELNEEVVRDARRAGIEFVRYAPSSLPRVTKDAVEVLDQLTNLPRHIEYDRLVLATPLVPHQDADSLARLFKLARDDDGFFTDPHQRLRPESQMDRGIFVCGSAHRPVDVDTAIMQGITAAARAARFVGQHEVRRGEASAWVDSQLCTGCAQCVEMCDSGAIEMTSPPGPLQLGNESTGRAAIDPLRCLACGNCVVACPSKAIDLPSASDRQILAQIDAALAARRNGTAPVLVFACQWSGFAAMELAGARRMTYPASVRVVELPCSARLDPLHVLFAFNRGADKVTLALCPPGECHFGSGNQYAEARIVKLREQLAAHGIAPERLQIARMMGDDADAWVTAMNDLTASTFFNLGHALDVLEADKRRQA